MSPSLLIINVFCLDADIAKASSHGSKIVPVCIDDSKFIEQLLCQCLRLPYKLERTSYNYYQLRDYISANYHF